MPISEKSRSSIYRALSPLAGEEAVGEMLSYFPAREVEEPVTRDHLDARLAELRVELHTEVNRLLVWLTGTVIATVSLGVTATVALVG